MEEELRSEVADLSECLEYDFSPNEFRLKLLHPNYIFNLRYKKTIYMYSTRYKFKKLVSKYIIIKSEFFSKVLLTDYSVSFKYMEEPKLEVRFDDCNYVLIKRKYVQRILCGERKVKWFKFVDPDFLEKNIVWVEKEIADLRG